MGISSTDPRMTKTFCDRCGVESTETTRLELRNLGRDGTRASFPDPQISVDVCPRCYAAITNQFHAQHATPLSFLDRESM